MIKDAVLPALLCFIILTWIALIISEGVKMFKWFRKDHEMELARAIDELNETLTYSGRYKESNKLKLKRLQEKVDKLKLKSKDKSNDKPNYLS